MSKKKVNKVVELKEVSPVAEEILNEVQVVENIEIQEIKEAEVKQEVKADKEVKKLYKIISVETDCGIKIEKVEI